MVVTVAGILPGLLTWKPIGGFVWCREPVSLVVESLPDQGWLATAHWPAPRKWPVTRRVVACSTHTRASPRMDILKESLRRRLKKLVPATITACKDVMIERGVAKVVPQGPAGAPGRQTAHQPEGDEDLDRGDRRSLTDCLA